MQLNIKSQSILNKFVECCLTLDEERITIFLNVNPSLIKVCEDGSDPMVLYYIGRTKHNST